MDSDGVVLDATRSFAAALATTPITMNGTRLSELFSGCDQSAFSVWLRALQSTEAVAPLVIDTLDPTPARLMLSKQSRQLGPGTLTLRATRFARHDAAPRSHLAPSRSNVEAFLRYAAESDRVELLYQPVLSGDGSIAGAEALLRLRAADGRLIRPAAFLEAATASGLLERFTDEVIGRALSSLARWDRTLGARAVPTVAINLSTRELHRYDLPARIAQALGDAGLTSDRLVIDVRACELADGGATTQHRLRALRSLGVTVAVDGLTTPLPQLARGLAGVITIAKLSPVLLSCSPVDASARHAAKGIVRAATGAGLATVATGIETANARAAARAMGCPQLQGNHFSAPALQPQLTAWLQRRG